MSWSWLFWVGVGYLCGSVPVAWFIGRAHGVDIRRIGSGNVGATNVGRYLGRRWGVICLLLDVLKGLGPVLAAGLAMGVCGRVDLGAVEAWNWLAVAAAAVVGHVFPVWLRFRGGKGVATGLGVLLGFHPILTVPMAVSLATWLLVVFATRYVGLASVLAAGLLPLYVLIAGRLGGAWGAQIVPFVTVTALMGLLVLVRHRTNLARLLKGTEAKIGSPVER